MPALKGFFSAPVRRAGRAAAIGLSCLLVGAAAWAGQSAAGSGSRAFAPGERLTFVLKWTVVPAGEAVLEVLPVEQMAGQQAQHFVLTARSNAFVDAFFMVRDRIDAWANSAMDRSLRYQQKQHEGRTQRDVTVLFDWDAMTAQYLNRGEAREPIAITDGTFDPLSIFYWFRLAELSVGGQVRRPVTDGKKHVQGTATVVGQETVTVPAGTFDTYLVEPDLTHVGGVFEKSPQARIQIWVSADHRRLPVKLKSKVIVGSFSGELVRITQTDPTAPAPGE
jgi:hypothetical protein